MGRLPDPDRRERTLARATDYVLAHGLAGVSLRPLAAALGISTRMLLYDFTSKEQLIVAVLAEARRREAALLAEFLATTPAGSTELLQAVWEWISAPEREPFLRLFFAVYIDAATNPEAYGHQAPSVVTDWLSAIETVFTDPDDNTADAVASTLVIAVVRGLLLDRLATGEPDRTNQALTRFTELL